MTSSSVPGITTGISESLPSWSSGSRVVCTDRFLLGEGVLFTCLPAEKNYQILICGLQSRYPYLRLYNTLNLDEIYQMCDRCHVFRVQYWPFWRLRLRTFFLRLASWAIISISTWDGTTFLMPRPKQENKKTEN